MRQLFKAIPMVLVLLLAAWLTGSAQPVEKSVAETTVDAILSRYVAAMGGRERIESVTSRVSTGTQITDFLTREHPTYESLFFEMHARAPMRHVFESWSDQGGFKEGYDGQLGWAMDKCGVRSDDRVAHSKLAFLLSPQAPLNIERYFPGLTYAGAANRNGIEVHALVPSTLPTEHYTLYFSTATHLLVGVGYYWTIDDYRTVDSLMIPHRIATSRKGGSTVYEIKTVTHNVAMPDSLFVMPEK